MKWVMRCEYVRIRRLADTVAAEQWFKTEMLPPGGWYQLTLDVERFLFGVNIKNVYPLVVNGIIN